MSQSGSGHYVKGSGRGSLPGRIVVIVPTIAVEDRSGRIAGAARVALRGCALVHCQRRGPGYSRPVLHRFVRPDQVWEWLESPALSGRMSYVFSPVASDALTLLRFWDRLEQYGCRWSGQASHGPTASSRPGTSTRYSIRRWVLAGSPDILDYSVGPSAYRWCSARNYYREPESQVAAATGYQWTTLSDSDDSAQCISADDGDRALMWCHAITSLALWWRDRHAGRFPLTVAGMGYSYLRSRMPAKSLCSHTHDDVIRLERKCCHGGRATLWYVGDVRPQGRYSAPETLGYPSGGDACIPGPVHHVDIRSMYPSIMRDHDFPAKYYTQMTDISPDTLREILQVYHVCARVSLDTDRAEYPYRHHDRVIYPTGKYTAYLTSPDLSAALDHDAITRVHVAALYYRGRPFQRAAIELLGMRADAERDGNHAQAKWCKLLANSCTGKLAQRKYQWVPCDDISPRQSWGAWYDLDARDGTITQYKTLAGLVWRRTNDEGGIGTLTAAYATLTAYGRVMMRQIRESLPPRSVISQDTDGLWITDSARLSLDRAHALTGVLAGSLRLVLSAPSARYWTAQHYTAGGSWTLAGFCEPVRVPGSASFYDHQTWNPIRGAPLGPPTELIRTNTLKTLDANAADGIHGDDGWMTPYRLPGGAPTKHAPPPPTYGLLDLPPDGPVG